ncbi:hypothetical protein [Halalkalibacterium ligniniphilum]|uniref:hypothetical protein n=1 Tax=Halalkalibacterium ligniniphilum TaxID=1134413 RepID=UPI0003498307|nr:hypothetical protein [Halalkalibacterium ligniniphilum]
MEKQPAAIIEATKGKLDQKLPKPFFGLETVEDPLAFAISQEALHYGQIRSLVKAATRDQAKT